ncbi:MAG TPA: divalent-cation tolerance protein CutA [Chromatiales bacterium]|nr:divalent-cation tolerance protein CutA [Chromatiales bacterium]
MPTHHRVVLCTCPDEGVGAEIGRMLVERRLAACVNVVPGLTSIYRWRGRVETDREVLLVVKTTAAALPALTAAVRERHPYELPEIVAVGVEDGLEEYLKWVDESVAAGSRD